MYPPICNLNQQDMHRNSNLQLGKVGTLPTRDLEAFLSQDSPNFLKTSLLRFKVRNLLNKINQVQEVVKPLQGTLINFLIPTNESKYILSIINCIKSS